MHVKTRNEFLAPLLEVVCESLLKGSVVSHLDLSGCALANDGIKTLGEILPSSQIISLRLENNGISRPLVEVLALLASRRGVLRTLNLRGNDFGGVAVFDNRSRTIIMTSKEKIVAELAKFEALVSLDISECGFIGARHTS